MVASTYPQQLRSRTEHLIGAHQTTVSCQSDSRADMVVVGITMLIVSRLVHELSPVAHRTHDSHRSVIESARVTFRKCFEGEGEGCVCGEKVGDGPKRPTISGISVHIPPSLRGRRVQNLTAVGVFVRQPGSCVYFFAPKTPKLSI